MDAKTRRALIEKYKEGYRAVTEALQGISERELDVRPAPGKWSPREIVHHLADSEMTSAIRLRRLIAEDRPASLRFQRLGASVIPPTGTCGETSYPASGHALASPR